MILTTPHPISAQTNQISALEALRTAKAKVFTQVSGLSLKSMCYGASIVFSMLCVIHARKGKIITAATLAVLTEIAMFFASTKKSVAPNPLIKIMDSAEEKEEIKSPLLGKVSYTPPARVNLQEPGKTALQEQAPTAPQAEDKLTKKEFILLTFLAIVSMSR